ncbi:SDR family NAD(P)-dependent oxidoreductase [Sinosporangium siamense]|uniref:Beta-ketoacyl-ACP reductase n=1 Tax=Sinosporangium siamense TaxID=1367973 RepID=A0A919RGE4_9ACTN|nr:SDR family oxidoreductase [Sinosporangium siamense]GII92907.1 beta-ketoacyl-ACP reductase [Sinosporangium siamense]
MGAAQASAKQADTTVIQSDDQRRGNQGVAIVTGGAGGIGQSIARRLMAEGFDVVVGDLSAGDGDEKHPSSERGAPPVRALDVTSVESVNTFFDRVSAEHGTVDVLVNAAGVIAVQRIEQIKLADWTRILGVNLTGTFLCTQRMLGGLPQGQSGRIVNISSQSGKMGSANVSHYCAAKFGVVGFTQAIAMEVAARGVTVNAVCPTMVETDMMADVLAGHQALGAPAPEVQVTQLKAMIPVGRLAQPADVASVVSFLCSREADFITGQAINVTGGAWMS